MIDFTEMRNRARSLLNDEAETWLSITADQTARDLLALCDEIERLEAAYANVVARVATNHMTNLLNKRVVRGLHKPQSRDGCGDDSCQHCLQYNWSDPGR